MASALFSADDHTYVCLRPQMTRYQREPWHYGRHWLIVHCPVLLAGEALSRALDARRLQCSHWYVAVTDEERNATALGSLLVADRWSGSEREPVLRLFGPTFATDAGPAHALLASEEFARSRRRTSIERAGRGKAAWNDWASTCKLIAASCGAHKSAHALISGLMTTDLADHRFAVGVDLSGRIFPGDLACDRSTFVEWVDLRGSIFEGRLSVRATRFMEDVVFESSSCRATDFDGARFARAAEFRSVMFAGPASFDASHFAGSAWFRASRFRECASFTGAVFESDAGFGSCHFDADADFSACRFAGHAGFDSSRFAGRARFDHSRFDGMAWFSDATFATAPSFDLARFAGTTRFDRVAAPAALNPVATQLDELRRRLAD